jgi:hypothetical protein
MNHKIDAPSTDTYFIITKNDDSITPHYGTIAPGNYMESGIDMSTSLLESFSVKQEWLDRLVELEIILLV